VPHGQILAFNMRRANPVAAWIASFHPDFDPDEWSRPIPPRRFHLAGCGSELFYHNGIVQPFQKALPDDCRISGQVTALMGQSFVPT